MNIYISGAIIISVFLTVFGYLIKFVLNYIVEGIKDLKIEVKKLASVTEVEKLEKFMSEAIKERNDMFKDVYDRLREVENTQYKCKNCGK